MKRIPLTKGKFATVDDQDYEYLIQWSWHYTPTGYAMRGITGGGTSLMHRDVLRAKPGTVIDHINGDGLDNRRANLRFCTLAENGRNRKRDVDNTSGFKGVNWHKIGRKWQARIRSNGHLIYLGQFQTAVEAARAYDEAAKKYHGEFAKLNFE